MDHFITSLRDEVRILKELPPRVKKRVELGMYHAMPPISWSNMSYYQNQVNIPRLEISYSLLLVVLNSSNRNRFFHW